jgi:hypothetical protein
MRKAFALSVVLGLAMTFALVTNVRTVATNPFLINGVVTDAANSKASGAATLSLDGHSNDKELGPAQGTATKLPVIDTATPTMLAETNPNPGTDLHKIYSDTEKDGDGNTWFYFGFTRDNNTGSAYIGFEAHQVANDCASYDPADLLDCNPWSPRTNGDFIILWDTSGSAHEVYLRIWNGATGKFEPEQPGLPLSTLLDDDDNPVVAAVFNSNFSAGELAINLTGADLIPSGACKAFANVLPLSVTGNSPGDTSDIKDAVFAPISIDTCSKITVTKITQNPDGSNRIDTSNNFSYTISKGGAILNAASQTSITDSLKGCTGTSPCAGPVDTHEEILAGSGFTLVENGTIPGGYELVSISCGGNDLNKGATSFSVPEATTVACVITNKLPPGDPAIGTTPTVKALLYDTANIKLGQAIAANTTIADGVTFELFTTDNCAAGSQVGTAIKRDITFTDGISGSATTLPASGNDSPPAFLIITSGVTRYWKVTYKGDAFNSTKFTCGEATTVTWVTQ